jgi:iron(III) transport system substrate-binding protein
MRRFGGQCDVTVFIFILPVLVLLAGPTPTLGYRPFVSTDAAVVDLHEIELELGYFNLEREKQKNTYSTPQIVLNYGLFLAWEVVGEFVVEKPPGAEVRLVDPGLFLKGVLKDGVLQNAKGVSAPYRSPHAEGLPEQFSDPDGHWTGFSARARVLIYNRNLVPAGQEPRSVMDLLAPRFKARACIANPLFGTTSMHAAALFAVLGEEKAQAFFAGFTANGGKMLSSNGEVRRRVAAGEFAVGITDTDDVNVARLEGKPVGLVYPDADGMGTLIIPNCVMLIAGSPHPDTARQFIDYLLQPESEKALAESEAAQMPLRPGVPAPLEAAVMQSLKPMAVNYASLAGLLETLSKGYLKEWVDRQP